MDVSVGCGYGSKMEIVVSTLPPHGMEASFELEFENTETRKLWDISFPRGSSPYHKFTISTTVFVRYLSKI
jgi:hypothetical protein